MAHAGLQSSGVDEGVIDRLLTVIERRCVTGRTGAQWQIDLGQQGYEDKGLDRWEALRRITRLRRAHAPQRPGPHLAARLTLVDKRLHQEHAGGVTAARRLSTTAPSAAADVVLAEAGQEWTRAFVAELGRRLQLETTGSPPHGLGPVRVEGGDDLRAIRN